MAISAVCAVDYAGEKQRSVCPWCTIWAATTVSLNLQWIPPRDMSKFEPCSKTLVPPVTKPVFGTTAEIIGTG